MVTDVAVLIHPDGTEEDVSSQSQTLYTFLDGEVIPQFDTDEIAKILKCDDTNLVRMTGDIDGYDQLYYIFKCDDAVNWKATAESVFTEIRGNVLKLSYRMMQQEHNGGAIQ